ncbi:hypothetical protein EVAR_82120_1 [Eumeta japonica]|uniref:Uncharacterized protein n=1 Tax=Eumeta variegata TaxID=151549 RepID=A0A4C1U271_EUMVA|nr:hypothetical protein EVAR_82120_1 [Eumeta japonica]
MTGFVPGADLLKGFLGCSPGPRGYKGPQPPLKRKDDISYKRDRCFTNRTLKPIVPPYRSFRALARTLGSGRTRQCVMRFVRAAGVHRFIRRETQTIITLNVTLAGAPYPKDRPTGGLGMESEEEEPEASGTTLYLPCHICSFTHRELHNGMFQLCLTTADCSLARQVHSMREVDVRVRGRECFNEDRRRNKISEESLVHGRPLEHLVDRVLEHHNSHAHWVKYDSGNYYFITVLCENVAFHWLNEHEAGHFLAAAKLATA